METQVIFLVSRLYFNTACGESSVTANATANAYWTVEIDWKEPAGDNYIAIQRPLTLGCELSSIPKLNASLIINVILSYSM